MNFCDEFMCSMGERHLLKDARKIPCGATYCLTCIRGKLSQRYSGKILDCPGCKSFHYVDDAAALPKDILFEMMFNDSFKCINNEAHEKLKKKVELLQGKSLYSFNRLLIIYFTLLCFVNYRY